MMKIKLIAPRAQREDALSSLNHLHWLPILSRLQTQIPFCDIIPNSELGEVD